MQNIFIPGRISFLLDAPAGSSGKGKLASYITKHSDVNFLLTSNSANASHTVIDNYNGKDYEIVFKALPSGSLYHDKLDKVFITAGSSFEVEALLKEIELIGIPRTKIGIHPRAGIITPIDAAYERGECDLDGHFHNGGRKEGTLKTGTTASGSGAVLAKKVLRHKTLKIAKDCPELQDMICIVEEEVLALLEQGKTGLFEIGQGFPLSNNYWRFAPNTTSRNVTVASALNDAFLPPSVVGNVIINTRTFPIRINSKKYVSKETVIPYDKILGTDHADLNWEVAAQKLEKAGFKVKATEQPGTITALAGKFLTWDEVQSGIYEYEVMDSYSGDWYPDQQEITWEDIEREANIQIPQVVKNTTLTKLPRRVATFSKINLDEAIKYNQTNHFVFLSINFINFVDGEMTGQRNSTTEKANNWIHKNMGDVIQKHNNAVLMFIGTSEKTDDTIVV